MRLFLKVYSVLKKYQLLICIIDIEKSTIKKKKKK